MRTTFALSAVAAIAAFSMLPAAAQTVEIPVAVLTVPVTLTALDGEAFKTMYVGCVIHDGSHVLAHGDTQIPLVVVPATPTVRSSASFSGNVTVNMTSAGSVGAFYKTGTGKTDPETAAMSDAAATIKAIGKTGQYQCALESSITAKNMTLLSPVGSTLKNASTDPKIVSELVDGKTIKSTTTNVVVESKLTP